MTWVRPAVTLDLVLLTDEPDPRLLLIRRARPPEQGRWALPGGFLEAGDGQGDQGEDLIDGARRELHEETGLSPELLARHDVTLAQIGAFGRPYRDPRERIVTIAYAGRVPAALVPLTRAGDDADDARWWPLSALDPATLAFDHREIAAAGARALQLALPDGWYPPAPG